MTDLDAIAAALHNVSPSDLRMLADKLEEAQAPDETEPVAAEEVPTAQTTAMLTEAEVPDAPAPVSPGEVPTAGDGDGPSTADTPSPAVGDEEVSDLLKALNLAAVPDQIARVRDWLDAHGVTL